VSEDWSIPSDTLGKSASLSSATSAYDRRITCGHEDDAVPRSDLAREQSVPLQESKRRHPEFEGRYRFDGYSPEGLKAGVIAARLESETEEMI
jgi:hypothetical protein